VSSSSAAGKHAATQFGFDGNVANYLAQQVNIKGCQVAFLKDLSNPDLLVELNYSRRAAGGSPDRSSKPCCNQPTAAIGATPRCRTVCRPWSAVTWPTGAKPGLPPSCRQMKKARTCWRIPAMAGAAGAMCVPATQSWPGCHAAGWKGRSGASRASGTAGCCLQILFPHDRSMLCLRGR